MRKLHPLMLEWLEERRLLSAAFDLIGVTDLRNDSAFSGIDGSGVSVAVIDTGLDISHPLIAPNYLAGADVVNGGSTPTVTNPHGTHVAGIVGSLPDPSRNYDGGVAPGVGLIGINVFSQVSGGEVSADNRSIEKALQWVIDNRSRYNIVAVNMSLGSGFYTSPSQVSGDIYRDEIDNLQNAGVTIVSAAGNTYGVVRDAATGQQSNLQFSNSSSPGIISTLNVGAVWEQNEGGGFYWQGGNTVDVSTGPDRVVSFSQRPPTGVGNAIFAPGAIIQSTWPDNQLHETQGTSMASPMVAGAVALLQDASLTFGGRLLSPTEVRDILQQTGDTIIDGDDEDDALFIDANNNGSADAGEVTSLQNTGNSYKRINVYNAVRFIAEQSGGGASVPAGDPNSVTAGAILGPQLNGAPLDAIEGAIGSDGQIAVGNKDVDLYRFTVAVAGDVTIEVAPNTDNPADFNSYLRLFRANGTQLAADDNSGAGDYSLIKRNLSPGTYYAGVSGAGNTTYNASTGAGRKTGKSGNFRIGFSLRNVDPNGVPAGAVAVNLTTQGEAPQAFNGFIGADFGKDVGVADVDLFRIVVPDNGTLFVDVDTPFDSDFVDSYVRIFDENLAELGANDDGLSVDVNNNQDEFNFGNGVVVDGQNTAVGHTNDAFVGGGVARGDVYFIGVSDFQNKAYDPGSLSNRIAAGTGGFYNLSINFVSNDRNGSVTQAVNVSSLPLIDQPGIIGNDAATDVGDRDVDVLKVHPTTDGLLEIKSTSFGLAGNNDPVDTLITLYDGEGTKLAQLDDVDGSADPTLRIGVPKNRDYYVAFSGKGNDSFDPFILGSGSPGAAGTYRIDIQEIPAESVNTLRDDSIASGSVQTITPGSSINASLGYDRTLVRGNKDVDLYRFVAAATGTMEVKAFTRDAFGADTFLRLFNSAGSEITFNDNDTQDTVNARMQFFASGGATYYIGVSGAGEFARSYKANGGGAGKGSSGNYVISIDGLFAERSGRTINVAGGSGNDNFRVALGPASTYSVFRGSSEIRFTRSQSRSLSLIAGAGNDVVDISPSINIAAYLDGGEGNDSLTGGSGDDTLTGGAGKNTLAGGNGDDRINGSGGRDLIFGGAGDDRLYGNAGNDTIDGGGNVDRLFGGAGDDSLIGATGNDKLYGEADNDTLIGAAGSDVLDGGGGSDVADDDNADSRTGIESLL